MQQSLEIIRKKIKKSENGNKPKKINEIKKNYE